MDIIDIHAKLENKFMKLYADFIDHVLRPIVC